MPKQAKATFQIDGWDENEILQTDGGAKVTHAQRCPGRSGDLEGEGNVVWLMSYDEGGSASFVGLERIVGAIGDKTGSFVLQHVGNFDGQTAAAQLLIVTGSDPGELSDLRGEGSFEAGLGPDGKRDSGSTTTCNRTKPARVLREAPTDAIGGGIIV